MNGTGAGDKLEHFFEQAQTRWLKPFEVFLILQNHDSNRISHQAPHLPPSGSLFLFDKSIIRSFRDDGHNWRKKKDKNSALESHEKLKVNNAKVLECYYAHGEDNRNFQRRSYWMLNQETKHIVLVHYRDITEGEASPTSASGQCYNLCQSDNGFPLENQGTASLNGIHGSNQSLCNLVTEQQCIDRFNDYNCYYGSVGTSQDVDGDLLWQALEQFGLKCVIARESIPFDAQKHGTDGTANSVLRDYHRARKLVEGDTLHEDRYLGSYDGMVSNSTVPTPSWEEIGSLLVPQEAEKRDLPSRFGTTDMDTYIPEPGELQMALEVEVDPSSLTIVSKHKFTIREISPQWGFADEATKVIIIGSFHCDPSKIAYACMFGDTQVRMEIIQEGVICCEAPPCRSAGKVTFCITSGNRESCSEVIDFEYRDRNSTFNNCIRPQQEEDRSTEEDKLLVRFAQMLLPNSSLQKEESNNFDIHPSRIQNGKQDSRDNSTEALQTGRGTSSGTIDQVLQELLKDKLLQWLTARFMRGGGTLPKKEQGIIHIAAALGYEWALNPLLNSGVGVNFRDSNGWAALHWAAKFGREKMVVALIKGGASAGAATYSTRQEPMGITPASIADANGHKGLAGYLTELAVITHLSSLTLEEASSVDFEAVDVSNISTAYAASGEAQHSMEQVMEANRNTARAATFIQAIFRIHSFRRRQQREAASRSNVDENGLTSDENQRLSSASRAVLPHLHDHNVGALPIQKTPACGKASKRSFKLHRKAVKIQPQRRGRYGVRKYKKVLWAAGILEKVALRWLRKGAGLRGYKPKREVNDDDDDDNEDILKDVRKEIVDRMMNEVSRVQSMVHCPEARSQYTRLRETSKQAKDNDTDVALMELLSESPVDSPGYSELWTQSVC